MKDLHGSNQHERILRSIMLQTPKWLKTMSKVSKYAAGPLLFERVSVKAVSTITSLSSLQSPSLLFTKVLRQCWALIVVFSSHMVSELFAKDPVQLERRA